MNRNQEQSRAPSRYGGWIVGMVMGALGGAAPWVYTGIWRSLTTIYVAIGAIAGLVAGMLWAHRLLINLRDDDTKVELIAAGIGWGSISGGVGYFIFWGGMAVVNWQEARMLQDTSHIAVLLVVPIAGVTGLIAVLYWMHLVRTNTPPRKGQSR